MGFTIGEIVVIGDMHTPYDGQQGIITRFIGGTTYGVRPLDLSGSNPSTELQIDQSSMSGYKNDIVDTQHQDPQVTANDPVDNSKRPYLDNPVYEPVIPTDSAYNDGNLQSNTKTGNFWNQGVNTVYADVGGGAMFLIAALVVVFLVMKR